METEGGAPGGGAGGFPGGFPGGGGGGGFPFNMQSIFEQIFRDDPQYGAFFRGEAIVETTISLSFMVRPPRVLTPDCLTAGRVFWPRAGYDCWSAFGRRSARSSVHLHAGP